MIPRVFHRIWLGGEPMPEEFERYGETWRRLHPGWEMRLWTDHNLPELRYRDLFDRGRNHAERADVLRQELLLRFGGVYLDVDVECRKSIEPLIDGAQAFAAWSHRGRIGNAVLGAVPGHPSFERILLEMRDRVGKGNVVEATGPKLVTRVLADASDVTIFGSETFYPYSPREADSPDPARLDRAYAIHHWEATWKTREELQRLSRRLKGRVDDLEAENAKLRRRLRRARSRRRSLAADLKRERRALRAVTATRYWRLRGRVARAAAALRRLLRSLRGRSG